MTSKVTVVVKEARNLMVADLNGSSDPYCIVTLQGTDFKGKTKVLNKNLNPVWNETYVFSPVELNESHTIVFSLFDKDNIGKDDPLGKLTYDLRTLTPSCPFQSWMALDGGENGELYVSLEVKPLRDVSAAQLTEEYIINHCRKNNCKWDDPDFPATDKALFKNPAEKSSKGIVTWKRPSEFAPNPRLFVSGVESGDVIQGALGDCYFLGALSVVATREDLLQPLFVKAQPEYGFYQIKFFKDGEWQVITIDDKLPIGPNGLPVYGRCKDIDEMWVPLIEKAYAKMFGCYEVLTSGAIGSALTDLTGESAEILSFTDNEVKQKISNGAFWSYLNYCVEEQFLMGCSYAGGGTVESDTGMGVLRNHAYAILNCKEPEPGLKLLCIRNPWGRMEWKGRFSDGSSDWTPELIAKLNVKFEDDGTFWMAFDDFIQHVGDQWYKFAHQGEWLGKTAGGCLNHQTWHDNPQYSLTTTKETKLFISLVQSDSRVRWESDYKTPIGVYVMKTSDNSLPKLALQNKDDIVGKSAFLPAREVAVEVDLQANSKYVVIPSTFYPGSEIKYWLNIYSLHLPEIHLIPPETIQDFHGEWKGASAGGCYNTPNWVNNPKYILTCNEAASAVVMLRQPPVKDLVYIGFYFGKWEEGKELKVNAIKQTQQCVNSKEVFMTVNLEANTPHYLMPTTFDAGEETSYILNIYSKHKIDVALLK